MMTLAPGIPAPEGSVTLPEILPKTACPKSVGGKAAKTTNKESGRARKALFMAHSNGFTPHADAPILNPIFRGCQYSEILPGHKRSRIGWLGISTLRAPDHGHPL